MTKVQTLGQGKAVSYSPRNRSSPMGRDSPARQLQLELEYAFAQVHLHNSDQQRLYAFNRRSLIEDLDAKEFAQAKAHQAEQDEASAQHETVRLQAEAVLQAHIKAEEERRRREEEERRRLEEEEEARRQREEEARRRAQEERRRKEQADRKATEEREKAEAARKAAEEQRLAEVAEKERKEREATAQKEAEKEIRAKEAEAKRMVDHNAAEAAAKAPSPAATSQEKMSTPWSSDPEVRHKHYLVIHKKLKAFRKDFWESAKKDPTLKPVVGDMRRAIRTSVGQLTGDKEGNKKATSRLKTVITQAVNAVPSPPVVVNEYLPPHLNLLDKNSTTVPSLVLYLLSVLSKAVINAFVGECAVNTEAAEPIGTLAVQIFSLPELQFARNVPSPDSGIHYSAFGGSVPTPPMKPTSVSLTSVLLCKFHATAAMLFGVSGPESTSAGRMRLGWRLDKTDDGKKSFVTEQKQYERWTGLGAGYASISLRNFSKAKVINPYPPIHFWESVAWIVNTPAADVQTSQLIVLKSMLDVGVDRFVLFFGAAAVAVTREALIELPRRLPAEISQKPAAISMSILAESFKKQKHFSLA